MIPWLSKLALEKKNSYPDNNEDGETRTTSRRGGAANYHFTRSFKKRQADPVVPTSRAGATNYHYTRSFKKRSVGTTAEIQPINSQRVQNFLLRGENPFEVGYRYTILSNKFLTQLLESSC